MGRRRRSSPWWVKLIAVVAAIGLLAGAAEVALRLIIPGVISGIVRDELRLTDDHPVDVSLGGSALLHALGGGVGDVTVEVPDAPLIEGITADGSLSADRVPFDPSTGEISGGTVKVVLGADQLDPVISLLTQGVAQSGEVRDRELVVGRTIETFGQELTISARLGVQAVDGAVKIDPLGLKAAGFDLSAEQLAQSTGSLLDPILQPQTVCIADQLPAGATLTDITLSSTGSVRLEAALAPGILSDPAQQELGSCG
ncbi:LmeA family phospholipid-binding protein [Leucobacter sp. USHLN153]|uniref:LmeA family phospholipid-binding protein n=1 Tax=Leucobacter sp. USHLN153 TaxID=3081268 RepID=UPI003016A4EC